MLKDQRIVFIGGSAGLGLASALAASEQGAKIVLAGRSEEKLKKAKDAFKNEVESRILDISKENEIQKFFSELGSFDHLVITGGVTSSGACLSLESDKARQSFDAKFWGQYFSVKYGAPNISNNGSIVLFSGAFGVKPIANTAVMSSVNGALDSLGRALAIELAPKRVNVIAPGLIETERLADMPEKNKQSMEGLIKQLPLKHIGNPENIAQAVLYLLSNTYVTGTTLYVDGGYTLR